MKLLSPILIIIIAGLLFFLLVNPAYNEVTSLRETVSTYQLALDNSTDLQKTQDSLIEKYKNIKQEDKDRLNHFLPNTINNINFILEIEKIANIHGLQIKNVKFQSEKQVEAVSNKVGDTSAPQKDKSSYGTFPLEFTTDADYSTFVVFLKDLELNLRMIDVQSISFTVPSPTAKPASGVDPNIYSYSLKIQTYWLK